MQDSYEKAEYDQEDLISLIQIQAEESTHLDFNPAAVLKNQLRKRPKLEKMCQHFANADWSIIVYSLSSC